MDDIYNNIDDYNQKRKGKTLIVFDDVIADTMTGKKFQAMIKELFIRCRKLNISLVIITQSYFSIPKEVRLNSTHYQIAINHSAYVDYKDENLQKMYKRNILFLTTDTTLPADNPLRFRKNLF